MPLTDRLMRLSDASHPEGSLWAITPMDHEGMGWIWDGERQVIWVKTSPGARPGRMQRDWTMPVDHPLLARWQAALHQDGWWDAQAPLPDGRPVGLALFEEVQPRVAGPATLQLWHTHWPMDWTAVLPSGERLIDRVLASPEALWRSVRPWHAELKAIGLNMSLENDVAGTPPAAAIRRPRL